MLVALLALLACATPAEVSACEDHVRRLPGGELDPCDLDACLACAATCAEPCFGDEEMVTLAYTCPGSDVSFPRACDAD